ncbi:MAG: anaerobic ribonucleoside-triphosphate reductase activating protein [Trichlorobacter sp.]|uniref:anaerobic ribonucleoside-triphosphate reductase activating protein n=1 Tax=Trichlorobacter sp. TaxID=2911007 RepID=UPI002567646A|nr:anaerobic ribonucleoside-triphosphate reductase activating protein [Trichlorobacter sp.]MDK9718632.1 anaerobic ribonucleoside-triphosphate reductase activating protein [Trichlorobacter sp.]
MLNIGGLTPFTTIDYPGKLAAVIFCQGCSWRCSYCHNQHLLTTGQRGEIAWEEVLVLLEQRQGLLDAVVFSGGEPTLQPSLPDALVAVRQLGFLTGLHTGGSFPDRLAACLPHLDWVGMDLKAPFDCYDKITGLTGSGTAAEQSAMLLLESAVVHQFRTTVDPFLLQEGRIEKLKQMVAGWGEQLVLQECRPD